MSGITVTYTFPGSLGGGKVTMRELTAEQSLVLAKMFVDEPARRMDEAVKRSVVECRGVKWTPENRDVEWAALSAKVRDLLFGAYARLHVADRTEQDAFFDSGAATAEG